MPHDFTPDEQVVRTYYLHSDFSRLRHFVNELPYLLPVVIIAMLPRHGPMDVSLLVALLYLLAVYAWRMGSMKWLRATSTLVKKYEQRLQEANVTQLEEM